MPFPVLFSHLTRAPILLLDANNLDLPEEVMDHPIVRSLTEAANDLVTWSNVRILPCSHHIILG
jgi:Terpene synthase family 2, C-terminal metal binding